MVNIMRDVTSYYSYYFIETPEGWIRDLPQEYYDVDKVCRMLYFILHNEACASKLSFYDTEV